jgi:hypothetical protein
MDATLQSVFNMHFEQYMQTHALPLKHFKAANAIMACRTEAMGGHVQRCPDHHEEHVQYHSCKHRSCPRCHALEKARWVEQQQARLLACDHYHVIFTLPHELLDLWQLNTRWFANTLFQAARDTLITLLQDEKHLGATPGILMALHTWGRTLTLHPHVHCLVTGGGLDAQQQWRALCYDYLLPVAVVKALYKGKLLARLWTALQAGELAVPAGQTQADVQRLFRQLNDKPWNVRIQERYPQGHGVMLYLSRYVKGGAITDRRLLHTDEKQVVFDYVDHHDQQRKRMRLSLDHFLQRVLWHVPEPGQHTVRHYGLYAHHGRDKRARCREQLNQGPEQRSVDPLDWQRFMHQLGRTQVGKCSTCGKALLRCEDVARKKCVKNSLYKRAQHAFVQQDVRLDTAHDQQHITGPPR